MDAGKRHEIHGSETVTFIALGTARSIMLACIGFLCAPSPVGAMQVDGWSWMCVHCGFVSP